MSTTYSNASADLAPLATLTYQPVVNHSSLGRRLPVQLVSEYDETWGLVQDVLPDGISVRVRHGYPQGTPLAVRFGPVTLQGCVGSCAQDGNSYEARVVIQAEDLGQRSEQRFPLSEAVRIYPACDAGMAVNGLITDLSAGGLGVESPVMLRVGETVTIESEFHLAFGVVRYSNALRADTYHAGVQIFHIEQRDPMPSRPSRRLSILERLFPDFV